MSDLRIVQLTGSSAGGVGRHARELAAGLAAENRVILAGPADVVDDVGNGVRTAHIDIADRPRTGDARAVARIRSLARGADVLHAHGLRAGALAALALGTSGPGPRTALVVTLHNLPVGGARVQAVAAGLERLVAARADAVLGVSGDLVDRARRLGARYATRALVPAPPHTHRPLEEGRRRLLGIAPKHQMILTVARLAPQKGLDLLCDTAGLVADRVPGARWLVAGDGPLRAGLTDQIVGEDLPVILLGRRDDVPDLLAAADVVVSTSAWEGQPLNLQEALAAGAPIVATDVGGTREVTGDAARLVPFADPDALATQIAQVRGDEQVRTGMRASSLARAGELPSAEDALVHMLEIYARVLG